MSWPIGEFDQQPLQPDVDGRGKRGRGQGASVGTVEQRKIAVEIGAGAQMEAALHVAEMILRASHGIGRRHDGDVAENAALGLGGAQLRHQRVDGDDAGQFAGVEGRLDIGGRRFLRRCP